MNRFFFVAGLVVFVSASASAAVVWKDVEPGELSSGLRVTGRIIPQDGALNIVSARVQGRVVALLKREGERVEVGTPIFAISSGECSSLAEERRVAESRGLQELIDGVVNRERQLGLKVTADRCQVVAQQAGILAKRSLDAGTSFNLGDAMATILDVRRMGVELDIPEHDLQSLRVGQVVKLHLASDQSKTYTARIQDIVPLIDPVTRTTKARIGALALPPHVTLDALVFGEIDTGHQETLLKIPSSALVFSRNEQFVVKGTEDKPKAVAVQVVAESDSVSAVRPLHPGELKAGEKVAVQGAIFLFQKAMEGQPQ